MALDFSLIGQGPQFGNVLAAYQEGKESRRQQNIQNVLAQSGVSPQMRADEMMKYDPQMGMRLRQDANAQEDRDLAQRADAERRAVFAETDPVKRRQAAMQLADPEVVRSVAALDANARAEAKQKAEGIGGFLYTLRSKIPDAAARKQAIEANAANLQALGFTPEQISSFDPTDQNLDLMLGQTLELDTLLDMEPDQAKAPVGYQLAPNGGLAFIPGGPADPAVVDRLAGVRREAVTSRPMPKTGGGSSKPSTSGAGLDAMEAELRRRGLL